MMHTSVFQRPKASMLVHLVMGVIFGIAVHGLVRQLPQGDLATSPDTILQAVSSGQTHLLTLTAAAFGVGLGGNYLLSGLGQTLNLPLVGKVVAGVIGIVVIGGLVIGVTLDWFTGITVPLVMNTGIGLLVGCGLGWWSASMLPRQSLAAWSVGAIAALITGIGLIVLQ
jgi:hypothetical protein